MQTMQRETTREQTEVIWGLCDYYVEVEVSPPTDAGFVRVACREPKRHGRIREFLLDEDGGIEVLR